MKSVIHEIDLVQNDARRFGSATDYYPALLIRKDGTEAGLLFTPDDIGVAEIRGAANSEDVPDRSQPGTSQAPARQTWLVIALVLAVALLIFVR